METSPGKSKLEMSFAQQYFENDDISQKFLSSIEKYGWAKIKFPDIKELVTKANKHSETFFARTEETKSKLKHDIESNTGYLGFKEGSLSKHKESFEIGYNHEKWPNIDGFREDMKEFQQIMIEWNKAVMNILTDRYNLLKLKKGTHINLRILHYKKSEEDQSVIHFEPHKDFGTVTFLFRSEVQGLQIFETGEANYIDIEDDEFLVIIGSALEKVSEVVNKEGDGIKATLHQVKITETGWKDRYSIAFFCNYDEKQVMTILNKAKTEPVTITAKAYLREKLENLFADRENKI